MSISPLGVNAPQTHSEWASDRLEAPAPIIRAERHVKIIRPPAFAISTALHGLVSLTHYSDLLYTLTLFRLKVRYKQSALGWIWAALQPLALMSIYTIIFSRVTKVPTGGEAYPVFVFSGLLPWMFFANAVGNSVQGLVTYTNLLTKMYFPREIIPLSYVLAALADFLVASAILGCIMAHYHVRLTWNILYLLPIVLLLTVFTSAVAMFFSAVQVRFRDIGLAMPLALQVWIFTVPVVYSMASVPVRYRRFYLADPLAGLIDSFRQVILRGSAPDARTLCASGVLAFLCLIFAYLVFKASEGTMADLV